MLQRLLVLTTAVALVAADCPPDCPPNEALGSPDCPCLQDPWIHASSEQHNGSCSFPNNGEPCYPSDYGRGCAAHDQQLPPSCVRPDGVATVGTHTWCPMPWCYVNASNCRNRPWRNSAYFEGLTYSYETCGYRDDFYMERFGAIGLQGLNLRVGFPGDSGSGYTLTTREDSSGHWERDGSFVRFMYKIADEYNMTLAPKQWARSSGEKADFAKSYISPSSKLISPKSSFTACVHDVAIGEIDICIGNLWLTAERYDVLAGHGSFTAPLYSDIMSLAVHSKASKKPWKDDLMSVFLIIDKPLWVFIVLVVVVVGLSLYITDGDPFEERNDDRAGQKKMATGSFRTLKDMKLKKDLMVLWSKFTALSCKDLWKLACGLTNCIYCSLLGLLSAAPLQQSSRSAAGRFVVVGFGLFILFFIVNFTGMIAANAIQTALTSEITSIEDVIHNRKTVCLIEAAKKPLLRRYPQLGTYNLYRTYAASSEVLTAMDKGDCDTALVFHDQWENVRRQTTDAEAHCDKVLVGGTVLEMSNALAIRSEYQPLLSWAIVKAVYSGWYETAKVETQAEYWPANTQCGTFKGSQERRSTMTLQQMSGPVLVTFVCCLVGLVVHFLFPDVETDKETGDFNLAWRRRRLSSFTSREPGRVVSTSASPNMPAAAAASRAGIQEAAVRTTGVSMADV